MTSNPNSIIMSNQQVPSISSSNAPADYYTNYNQVASTAVSTMMDAPVYQSTAYPNSTSSTNNTNYRQSASIVGYNTQPASSSSSASSITNMVGSRLSGINLTSQAQDFRTTPYQSNNSGNTPYYKLTPTSNTAVTTTKASAADYYNNSNTSTQQQQQQQPQMRQRTSFYGELPQQQQQQPISADYSSYDMSGSQHTSGYSRVQTAGYPQQQPAINTTPSSSSAYRPPIQLQLQQQQQQHHHHHAQQQPPQQQQIKYNGPVPEDPLTAADSYRSHMN